MHHHGIASSLALASLTSGILANPALGKQAHSAVVAPGAVTTNGSCGRANGFTCGGSSFGDCCSVSGQCGSSVSFCGEGCQRNYGSCGAKGIKSFADGTPQWLKDFLKSFGISRHPPGPHNGTHSDRNGTHPGHRGPHRFNGTHGGKPQLSKNVGARSVEAEVTPRCARDAGGEVSRRCEHDADEGEVAPRAAQPTGADHRGGPGSRAGYAPSGTPPARPTGTHGPGGPKGPPPSRTPPPRSTGPPPSGTPAARPTGAHVHGGPPHSGTPPPRPA
ncbi:hypothetical protein RB597_007529 [Gaeumannomyces tritici]